MEGWNSEHIFLDSTQWELTECYYSGYTLYIGIICCHSFVLVTFCGDHRIPHVAKLIQHFSRSWNCVCNNMFWPKQHIFEVLQCDRRVIITPV